MAIFVYSGSGMSGGVGGRGLSDIGAILLTSLTDERLHREPTSFQFVDERRLRLLILALDHDTVL